MDQFRQVGEALGGIKALMVLKHDISINQRQCCLLLRIFDLAFETVSEGIKQNLRLEEKNMKWKSLENPLKELHRIFKEGETYIRYCLDTRDWWGKAISVHQSRDCVEFHIHNLLCCFAIVVEAIETAGEISGIDHDDMQKRRLVFMKKYDREWNDPKVFQWKFGKQYLVSREICSDLITAWKEDRWIMLETMKEKRNSISDIIAKHEQKLANYMIRKLDGVDDSNKRKLLPAWILLGTKDYSVKGRLGSIGSHHKEIFWLGESFALRNFFGEINEKIENEITFVLTLSHPNVVQYHCGFYDDEKKEGFLVMELMNKGLSNYVKENSGLRKRAPFSLPVAVDIMLQIARGMEYLHSKRIYHGDLNSSNILLKSRNLPSENYFYAKITGFGLTSIKSYASKNQSNQNGNSFIVWHAPEVVLSEQENGKFSTKFTEKADVYSFGMLCFEILTGKIPFEDVHLQEGKMNRNIRAGERPLFPFTSPKFIVNLIRKCWQSDPLQRPSFSSICRILRYTKKCLVIKPDHSQVESPPPLIDFCEIESGYSKLFPSDFVSDLIAPIWQIPFQMYAYKLVEKEKTSGSFKEKTWDISIEERPSWGELGIDQRSISSELQLRRNSSTIDQMSVCSETQCRTSPKIPIDQRSSFSENLWKKMDQIPKTPFDQKPISPEIKEEKTISDDQILDGSDQSPEKKTSSPIALDEICLEGKMSQNDGKLEIQESADLPMTEISEKSRSFSTTSRDILEKQKPLARTKSHPISEKTLERKFLPPIASSDSELGSISPERAEGKNIVLRKSSVQRSVRRKSLLKTRSVPTKTNKSPGGELSPRSSSGTDREVSPRSLPIERSHRFSRMNKDTKKTPWV